MVSFVNSHGRTKNGNFGSESNVAGTQLNHRLGQDDAGLQERVVPNPGHLCCILASISGDSTTHPTHTPAAYPHFLLVPDGPALPSHCGHLTLCLYPTSKPLKSKTIWLTRHNGSHWADPLFWASFSPPVNPGALGAGALFQPTEEARSRDAGLASGAVLSAGVGWEALGHPLSRVVQ